MAATAVSFPHIPVGEYLGSVYRPDVDYVDGVLEERNVGELDHADIQMAVREFLGSLRAEGYRATQETRVQVSDTRFRVPDVCLMPKGWKKTQIIRDAPLLCVEVLSPRDNVMAMRRRCEDYLRMGVPEVWIFDPQIRTAYVLSQLGMKEQRTGALQVPGSSASLDLAELFSVLDEE
jgi:Uma2 family endonuclease